MEDPIRCRLLSSSLAHGPSYEIFSGYWGEGTKRTPLLLSCQTYHVTTELTSALRRVRLENEMRLLWIQSVCINFDDLSERNYQIGMLWDIQKTSKQLLVWLSNDGEDSHPLFHYLREHEQDLIHHPRCGERCSPTESWVNTRRMLQPRLAPSVPNMVGPRGWRSRSSAGGPSSIGSGQYRNFRCTMR